MFKLTHRSLMNNTMKSTMTRNTKIPDTITYAVASAERNKHL